MAVKRLESNCFNEKTDITIIIKGKENQVQK